MRPLAPIVGINPNRLVAVAVVYLDDSGTHGDTPIITMAGYVFSAREWEEFERKSNRFLKEHRVPVFHAKVFNKAKQAPFKNWSLPKQLAFADGWFSIAADHVMRGITISLPKLVYNDFRKETRKNQNVSVYGQCFNGVLCEIKDDHEMWSLAKAEGLTVVLELGNKNNEGLKQFFYGVREKRGYEKELRDIGECAKEDCSAIQLADFLAFYSWHYAVNCYDAGPGKVAKHLPALLDLATQKVGTIGQLADGFSVAPFQSDRKRA